MIAALNRAKELCHLPDLTADSAAEWLETFQAKELEATEKMLSLEQKMSMAQTAHSQFEQAYQLVVAINGPLARNEAWDVARELLREGVDQRHLAEQVQPLRMRLSELEQRLREQQEAERLLADFCKRQGKNFDIDELEALHQELEARIASLSDSVSNAREERMALRRAGTAAVSHSEFDAACAGLAGSAKQSQPVERTVRRRVYLQRGRHRISATVAGA